jgi:hypothetical protein
LSTLAQQQWTSPQRQRPVMDQSTNEASAEPRPEQWPIPQRLLLPTNIPTTVDGDTMQGHDEVASQDTHDTLLSQPQSPRADSPPSVADRSDTRQALADTPAMSNVTTAAVGGSRADGAEEALETQPPPSSQHNVLVFHRSNGPNRTMSSSRGATTRSSTTVIDKSDASHANYEPIEGVAQEPQPHTPGIVSVDELLGRRRETFRNKASTATISRETKSTPLFGAASGGTSTRRTTAPPLESDSARPLGGHQHTHQRGRQSDNMPPVRAKSASGQEKAQPPRIRLAGDFIRAWFRV